MSAVTAFLIWLDTVGSHLPWFALVPAGGHMTVAYGGNFVDAFEVAASHAGGVVTSVLQG